MTDELIEFYIVLNKSIAALARKANIRVDENIDGFDPWLFISPLLCIPEEYDERDIVWFSPIYEAGQKSDNILTLQERSLLKNYVVIGDMYHLIH